MPKCKCAPVPAPVAPESAIAWPRVTALPTATTFADNTVVAGTTYVYRIRSTTLGANSPYSAEVTAVVPAAVTAFTHMLKPI